MGSLVVVVRWWWSLLDKDGDEGGWAGDGWRENKVVVVVGLHRKPTRVVGVGWMVMAGETEIQRWWGCLVYRLPNVKEEGMMMLSTLSPELPKKKGGGDGVMVLRVGRQEMVVSHKEEGEECTCRLGKF
jgi:hypothetical protein